MSGRVPPFVSIIVPVWRESQTINDLVLHVKGLSYAGKYECILVDGDAQGLTLAALSDAFARRATAEKGRARQMNAGASLAQGDILLFLHADTRLPEDGLSLAAKALEDPEVCAGAFSLRFSGDDPLLAVLARLADARNRLTRTPYGDQAIFVRREVFEELGGFADIPIMEDVEFMRRLRRLRRRVAILTAPALTSPRRYLREGRLIRAGRNLCLRALFGLGVSARVLARLYGAKENDP